jgi:hypothetical protein
MSEPQMKTVVITKDIKGIVRFEFIQQGQVVNQGSRVEILKRFCEIVLRKIPELCPNDWAVHHDSVSAHKALSIKQFLAQKSIIEMEHPLCSADLVPNDFWLFPGIKFALKGQRFQNIEDIKKSDDGTESCSTARVPEILRTVAASLG